MTQPPFYRFGIPWGQRRGERDVAAYSRPVSRQTKPQIRTAVVPVPVPVPVFPFPLHLLSSTNTIYLL